MPYTQVSPFGTTELVDDPQKAASTKPARNKKAPAPKKKKAGVPRKGGMASLMSGASGPPIFMKPRKPYSTSVLDDLNAWTDNPERSVKSGLGDALASMRRGENRSVKMGAQSIMKQLQDEENKQRKEAMQQAAQAQSRRPQGPSLPEDPSVMQYPQWLAQRYPQLRDRLIPTEMASRIRNEFETERAASMQVYDQRLNRFQVGQRAVGGGGGPGGGPGGRSGGLGVPSAVKQAGAIADLMQGQAAQTKANAPFVPSNMFEMAATRGIPSTNRLMGPGNLTDPAAQMLAYINASQPGGAPMGDLIEALQPLSRTLRPPKTLEAGIAGEQHYGSPFAPGRSMRDPALAGAVALPDILKQQARPEKTNALTPNQIMAVAPELETWAWNMLNENKRTQGHADFGKEITQEMVTGVVGKLLSGLASQATDIAGGLRGGRAGVAQPRTPAPSARTPVSPGENGRALGRERPRPVDPEIQQMKRDIIGAFPNLATGDFDENFGMDEFSKLMKMDRRTFKVALGALVRSGWITDEQAMVYDQMYTQDNPQPVK